MDNTQRDYCRGCGSPTQQHIEPRRNEQKAQVRRIRRAIEKVKLKKETA